MLAECHRYTRNGIEHANYRYAHDEPGGYAPGENYFPAALKKARFYHPVDRGLEQRIGERLERFRTLDAASSRKRYEDD